MRSRWITLGLSLVAAIILIVRVVPHGRRSDVGGSRATHAGSANAYLGLRRLVLDGTRANFGMGPGTSPTQPFAVVTEWADAGGTTTIIATADGSASVYHSNGAASIGGGQSHPSIRDAALRTVEAATAAQPRMRRTGEYPLASSGQVFFYAVTDAGVFTATAAQDDVLNNRSPFSALGAAAQNIVSEYRREALVK